MLAEEFDMDFGDMQMEAPAAQTSAPVMDTSFDQNFNSAEPQTSAAQKQVAYDDFDLPM